MEPKIEVSTVNEPAPEPQGVETPAMVAGLLAALEDMKRELAALRASDPTPQPIIVVSKDGNGNAFG